MKVWFRWFRYSKMLHIGSQTLITLSIGATVRSFINTPLVVSRRFGFLYQQEFLLPIFVEKPFISQFINTFVWVITGDEVRKVGQCMRYQNHSGDSDFLFDDEDGLFRLQIVFRCRCLLRNNVSLSSVVRFNMFYRLGFLVLNSKNMNELIPTQTKDPLSGVFFVLLPLLETSSLSCSQFSITRRDKTGRGFPGGGVKPRVSYRGGTLYRRRGRLRRLQDEQEFPK